MSAVLENKQLSVWGLSLLELYGKNNWNRKSIFYHIAGLTGNPSQLPTVTAASNSRRSFQQSLQPPAVAVTSGYSPAFVSQKSFPSAKQGSCSKSPEVVSRDRMVQLYYNSNIWIVETARRVETAIISQWCSTSSVFSKLFKIVITSGRPMIIGLINKVGDQFNT